MTARVKTFDGLMLATAKQEAGHVSPEKNYTNDKFVFEMDKKSQKSYLPLINRGVWSRVYGFENNIMNIVEYLKEIEYQEEINFIDLGSGFNTLYFNLQDKFENLKYVEIDYEDNTDRKVNKFYIILLILL